MDGVPERERQKKGTLYKEGVDPYRPRESIKSRVEFTTETPSEETGDVDYSGKGI